MECYCCLRNIQDLLSDGKTLYERRFGMPCHGPVIPFWSNGRISPYFCERPVATASVRLESLARYLSPLCMWRESGIEELEEMDASELHARRLNAKEVVTPQSRPELAPQAHFSLLGESLPASLEVARSNAGWPLPICSSGVDMVAQVSLSARGAIRRAQLSYPQRLPTLNPSSTAATVRLLHSLSRQA